jgi:hypothetical protein
MTEIIVMTSIVFGRGGDIGAAKNFIDWWKTQGSSVGVRLCVQYDCTSANRAKGLKQYAKDKDIKLSLYPARHLTDLQNRPLPEQLLADKNNALSGMTAFNDASFKQDVLQSPNTAAIVCIPNWHRVPDSLLDYLCNQQTKPFFPISEYNLLPDYGNLQTRRRIVELAIAGGKSHVKPIEMGFGSGPSAIKGRTKQSDKAGVFVPLSKQVANEPDSFKDHPISQLLRKDGNETYVGYFFQESLDLFEGEGRSQPYTNVRGKEGVITIQGYIQIMYEIANKSASQAVNVLLPGCNEENWEKIKNKYRRRIDKVSGRKVIFVDDVSSLDNSNGSDKVIRFIKPGFLPGAVFAKCIRESEPLMGITGDASFVESLLEGKVVLYQLLRWKTELLYSFVDLVRQKMPGTKLAEFYSHLLRHGEPGARSDLVDFYIKHKAKLSQNALTLGDIIREEYDVTKEFSKLFRKVLGLHQDTSTPGVSDKAEKNAGPTPGVSDKAEKNAGPTPEASDKAEKNAGPTPGVSDKAEKNADHTPVAKKSFWGKLRSMILWIMTKISSFGENLRGFFRGDNLVVRKQDKGPSNRASFGERPCNVAGSLANASSGTSGENKKNRP